MAKPDFGIPHLGPAIQEAYESRVCALREDGRPDEAQRLSDIFALCEIRELGIVFTVRQPQPLRDSLIAAGRDFVATMPVDEQETYWHNVGNDAIRVALMPSSAMRTILERHGVVLTQGRRGAYKVLQIMEDVAAATQVALRDKKGDAGTKTPGRTTRRSLAKRDLRSSPQEVDLSTVDMPQWTAFCKSLSTNVHEVLHPLARQLEKELQGMAGMQFQTDADADLFVSQLRDRLDELNVRVACLGDSGKCRHPSYLSFQRWGNSSQSRFKCEHAPAIGGMRYHGDSSRELPFLSLVPAQPHPLRK